MTNPIDELYELLDSHRMAGRDEASRQTLERIVTLAPQEPVPWIALAEQLSLMNLHQDAYKIARDALTVAKNSNSFVRQATGVLIRTAMEVRDYDAVEKLLVDLIAYRPARDSVDIAPEFDFLMRLPANAVSKEVIAEYRARFSDPKRKE